MATPDYMISARKKLILSNVKEKIQQIKTLPFDESEAALDKLHKDLCKSFKPKDAAELIEQAISNSDRMLTDVVGSVVGSMSADQLANLGKE